MRLEEFSPKASVAEFIDQSGLGYVPWEALRRSAAWDLVVVATPAGTQYEACLELLREMPTLKGLLLEKPATATATEAANLASVAAEHMVSPSLVDHYLLRAICQHFPAMRDQYLGIIGEVVEGRGWLTESASEAPCAFRRIRSVIPK